MKALIVFETLWGNTELVARAVAEGLSTAFDVDVADSDAAPTSVEGIDLLVVGGPTHAFSMTRESTRTNAVEQHGAPRMPSHGIREWLASLERPGSPVHAVTFDTRVDRPRLPGSAAKGARKELEKLGFDMLGKAETFRVHDYGGPLVDGERERAAEWGRQLATSTQLSP